MVASDAHIVRQFQTSLLSDDSDPLQPPLPGLENISVARGALVRDLPQQGLGVQETLKTLETLKKGFWNANQSSLYFGFVTGGINPAAAAAESLVSVTDQNVQVHLPAETISTEVEYHALSMLCQLFELDPAVFQHRIFTTGATASNVLGLACAREHVLRSRGVDVNVAELGIVQAMRSADVDEIQVLTTIAHSSLAKAASIVGLGRGSIHQVSQGPDSVDFDWEKLEEMMQKPRAATIVAVSCAEVNTGLFAYGMKRLRNLCDRYKAYIHVDAAFSLSARCLRNRSRSGSAASGTADFDRVIEGCEGVELADSITGDAHKLLNVPYDCGFFFSRDLDMASEVFRNAGAAYLAAPKVARSESDELIPSPLNIGIENSRRFRALPVYASLLSYGISGLTDMVVRQVELAREVALRISRLDFLQLLPSSTHENGFDPLAVFVIVLFRAKNEAFNQELVQRVKKTCKIYISGTKWEGSPAARLAVSNWQASASRDAPMIEATLQEVYEAWQSEQKG